MKTRCWLSPFFTPAISILAFLPAAVAAPSLLQQASPQNQQIFAGIKADVLREAAQPPLILAENNEVYFWLMSARLVPLMEAYQYSHDPAFLDAFVPLMQQVLSQRYIHPTRPEWDGWFNYKTGTDTPGGMAELDHESILYYVPALMFVQSVRQDDVQRSIWAWDKRGCWHELTDKTGWYTFPSQYPDSKTGELVNLTALQAGAVVPYNKVHALDQALTLAYQITGDKQYRQRMEKTATFFRAHWRMDDKHVEWNYRDHTFSGDYTSGVVGQGPPKTGAFVHPHPSYYILDSNDIVMLYDQGIVFTLDDIKKLVQTNLEFMFMGDAAHPTYKMINGTYVAAGKYNKGTLWPALAQFSDKTRQLWKTELDNTHGWASTSALHYLIEMAQPVSWDPRPAAIEWR